MSAFRLIGRDAGTEDGANNLANSASKRIALRAVFLWFLGGGLAHFLWTDAVMTIVPPYVPSPRAAVLVSGALELLGAVGVLHHWSRRAAGMGLIVVTVAVTPANIYMLERHDLFHVPFWLLVARLPLQVILLSLIVWSTLNNQRVE